MTTQATVDVPGLLDEQKVSSFQIRVLVLCALAVMLDGFDTQAIGYVAPDVARDLHLGHTALSPVFASGLLGVMIGALTFGPDRRSVRAQADYHLLHHVFWFGFAHDGHGRLGEQPDHPEVYRRPRSWRSDAECHRAYV